MPKRACNICGSREVGEFGGRKYALCPNCKSLERQRSFVDVWNTYLANEIPMNGKTALLIAPFESDKIFFSKLGVKFSTLDIRPELKTDIIMDLCGQSTLSDGAWDLVYCSHVLPHLYDLDAALDNILRAMSPQGVFISQNPARVGQPTEEFSDEAGTARHMPMKGLRKRDSALDERKAELLKTQRVGVFRIFGDLGLLKILQEKFITKTFDGKDPVSDRRSTWVVGWKKGAADAARDIPPPSERYVFREEQ